MGTDVTNLSNWNIMYNLFNTNLLIVYDIFKIGCWRNKLIGLRFDTETHTHTHTWGHILESNRHIHRYRDLDYIKREWILMESQLYYSRSIYLPSWLNRQLHLLGSTAWIIDRLTVSFRVYSFGLNLHPFSHFLLNILAVYTFP